MNEEEGRVVVRVLACVLDKLVAANQHIAVSQAAVSKFQGLREPGICIHDYLQRICRYSSCSMECFVLALVYIDRLIQRNNFVLTSLNVHRIIITSVMLAAKFLDDQYFNNAFYARVGGVPCAEINALELEFLFLINFSLYVTTDAYHKYLSELESHARSQTCPCSRGMVLPPPSPAFGFPDAEAYGHRLDMRHYAAAGAQLAGEDPQFAEAAYAADAKYTPPAAAPAAGADPNNDAAGAYYDPSSQVV
eukprot:CAMPEP_0182468322 /NCGR_PEP_ID=MMETSP1319-20130603/15314_1 /TAXON_ID=172717 /ORGANISM="Bolidomonas pacifica, Strain RCC208" /LENGTH=248 /DNA_ID=CAMNT_0024668507 /DNA_START=19 /DNA_END=761 /DNA_ORIENTATION=-